MWNRLACRKRWCFTVRHHKSQRLIATWHITFGFSNTPLWARAPKLYGEYEFVSEVSSVLAVKKFSQWKYSNSSAAPCHCMQAPVHTSKPLPVPVASYVCWGYHTETERSPSLRGKGKVTPAGRMTSGMCQDLSGTFHMLTTVTYGGWGSVDFDQQAYQQHFNV